MTGHRVLASIELITTERGGLSNSLPAGTRSALVRFRGEDNDPISFGAVITPTDRSDLTPGARLPNVELIFWADSARLHATSGETFDLWYGRVIGHGVVTGPAVDE